MEPLAIIVALLAATTIVVRGALVVAPQTTLALYRRGIATARRVRILGLILAAYAAPLVALARAARSQHGGFAIGLEMLGWALAAGAAWLLIFPDAYRRLADSILDAVSEPAVLRITGMFGVAFGAALAWIAFAVL